jgi:hypothetical protein
MRAGFVIREWIELEVPGDTLAEALTWAADPKNQREILTGKRGKNRELLDHNITLCGVDDPNARGKVDSE